MREIRRLVSRIEVQDIFLREAIQERVRSEPRPLRSDFPTYTQVFRDRVVPANYYEAVFGASSISLSLTSKRGGVSGMICSGGAVVVENGTLLGTSNTLGAEECPASSLCSQSGGTITYTPHSY